MIRLIIILNLLLISKDLEKNTLIIKYNEQCKQINLIKYNNQKYISISELPKIFAEDNDIFSKNYFIERINEKLIFSDLTFFVVYRNETQMRVAQMNLPSIIIKDNLQIPFKSFLETMNTLGLIKCYFETENILRIQEYSIFRPKINIRSYDTIFIHNHIEELPQKTDKIQKNTYEFKSENEQERGKYTIPRSLKKIE